MDTYQEPQSDVAPVKLLTSEHVHTLPRLDKARFMHSYLQGQNAYADTHASEGRTLFSWNRNTPSPDRRTPIAPAQHCGFGTPVLKPRVARHRERLPDPAITEDCDEHRPSHTNAPQKQVPQISDMKVKLKPPEQWSKEKLRTVGSPSRAKAKSPSKKRAAILDEDEDRAARRLIFFLSCQSHHYVLVGMAERRERKRAKRAILQPVNDKGKGRSLPISCQQKLLDGKSRGKNGKNMKVFAGFALMHGFSATNIGKHRLTVCDYNATALRDDLDLFDRWNYHPGLLGYSTREKHLLRLQSQRSNR
jgi:hypothetical protein